VNFPFNFIFIRRSVPIDDPLSLKTEESESDEDRMAEELDSDSMRGCAGREGAGKWSDLVLQLQPLSSCEDRAYRPFAR
jgi:hypothetical protein